jgi:FkbM family methyltransferase
MKYQEKVRRWIHNRLHGKFCNPSYAQEGEDMVLRRIFETKKESGCYVDVGAHHPRRFSNTRYFYSRGWRGINIDPLPGSMHLFELERAGDVNLEVAVGSEAGSMMYYQFNDAAMNTFSRERQELLVAEGKYRLIAKTEVPVLPLRDILSRHLKDRKIDFLSIDVEGFEVEVLRSSDWEHYRPSVVLMEAIDASLDEVIREPGPAAKFLTSRGYRVFAKTVNTVFFLREDFSWKT